MMAPLLHPTSALFQEQTPHLIPQLLGKYDFNISLKRESDDWKVNSAMWVQAEMVNTWEDDDSYDESG
jgi:hypothetical protein